MKIGLDVRMLDGGSGISRYIFELTTRILELDKTNKYVLFFNQITPKLDAAYRKYGCEMIATGIKHYGFAEQFKLPGILKKHNLDLMHFPHFNVPLFYRKPFVVTIHDLTHTKFPGRKKSRFFHRLAYNLTLVNAVKRAKKIIAVSNFTKTELLEYFKFLTPDKIITVYEGFSSNYSMVDKQTAFEQVAHDWKISKPYILYVGVWRRYKNLPMLALAFDRIAEKLDIELVLAGDEDPFYPEIKDQILGIKNRSRIKVLGRVTDEDLKYLYNAAELTVLPSKLEGFGLPVIESAACGTAVACSDIPTLREVMGSAAEYFDPENLDNITDVLRSLMSDPKRREDLANLGLARTKHFDWKKAAQETINVYETV